MKRYTLTEPRKHAIIVHGTATKGVEKILKNFIADKNGENVRRMREFVI